MKDRIIKFLQSENKSSSQFADEIGVQPSGISHIISGRNNPSLDFIIKMLARYPNLSTDWLLFGKGRMYKDSGMLSLFDNELSTPNTENQDSNRDFKAIKQPGGDLNDLQSYSENVSDGIRQKKAERIVYFFTDGTFIEYIPGNR